MRRLARKKVFVVLDDVAASEQIQNLSINNNCLGLGSRVIVTTRDKQICSQFDECEIYEVKGLNEHDSLQLFGLNAFKEKHHKNGYEELSKCVIGYCKGNPLALKVLSANLRSKSKEAWKSELKKLQKIPNGNIHSVLKLSYNDLDCDQKNIFLDIACLTFSEFWDRDRITCLFEACDFFAASGIEVLLEKALITTSYDYHEIGMHDLLREMGREIVNQESKDPGKRSRLWKFEEVYDVLKNNKGTEDVEVIAFDISEGHGDLYMSSDSFKRMTNLRFLEIIAYNIYKVHFPDGLGWLSDRLRYLGWEAFPLESLPSTFCAEMLVEFHMPKSKLKKLWDGVQNVSNLKKIDLRRSKDLIEIPDLSSATNFETLCLFGCVSLRELHPSILSLPNIISVNLYGCKKIESLKSNIHSKSLCQLNLGDCSSLAEFSVTSEEMMLLHLKDTDIRELSSLIWRNSKLTVLDLSGCDELNIVGRKLSNDTGLGSLTELNLSRCTQINASNLWFILDGIRSLYKLNLRECCNLEALPDNIQNHSMLEELELDDCRKLVFSLTELPPSLQYLTAVNCTFLDEDSTQWQVLENGQTMFEKPQHEYDNRYLYDFLFLPGGQVPGKFAFHITTEASITIPPIPKSVDLCGFIFCIILSEGLDLASHVLHCFIHEHDKEVGRRATHTMLHCGALISDHILLFYCNYNKEKSGSDLYNLISEFKLHVDEEEEGSTEGIKGCGVIPVYALEHGSELDGNSSRHKIVELESSASAQVFDNESDQHLKIDIDESQPITIGGHEEVEGSINENEDDQQQQQPSYSLKEEEEEALNEKSSCNCSIGLLLRHLLGGSSSKQ